MKMWLALILLIFYGFPGQASVGISPVIVESYDVAVGQVFELVVWNETEHYQNFNLSLGRFWQNPSGAVRYEDTKEAAAWASKYFNLSMDQISLAPGERGVIQLVLHNTDFVSIYPIMFVSVATGNIRSRMATLFLLATNKPDTVLQLVSANREEGLLQLDWYNPGQVHSVSTGIARFFDSQGLEIAKSQLSTGRILPGYSRLAVLKVPEGSTTVEISMSDWVEHQTMTLEL